ncbi:GNAT family N-acetyltransferase [Idiomarina sp. HP20-50]|uniref:GNAT family N-acetyltransferase n=1 Tax=Idiomarina sp. HP20-50 TaxID=3070813 RepID=UPI00294AF9CA|nr:GNAT family N-acetyltransferase [Idiomarina sp. HP20-50]MDV6315665.1 GNAT family N-acetyltransferase [Idiomarina sp. HP20-50]
MKRSLPFCLLLLILPLSFSAAAADFWKKDWVVPEYAEGTSLIIRPLKASDTDRFFHSYMTSQKWLYNRLGWAWPSEKSSLEQNETMVNYHLEQAREHTAFTYLVIDKSDNSIIGAVYMVPVAASREEKSGISRGTYNAEVSWWLLQSAVNDNLHNDFFALLTDWLEASWPWRQVLFPVSEDNETTVQLLETSNARSLGRNLDAREKYFSYSISRK